MFKRLSFTFIFFLIIAFSVGVSFANPIFANDNYIQNKQSAINKGTGLEAWSFEALGSNIVGGINILAGTIPDDILNGKVTTGWIPSGFLGVTNNVVASLYNQPASGIEYIAQIKDSFLGKPAYAQGVGFKGLEPLLPIWRGFRNIVYILSSIVFIAIGIMIMLRIKISPQAVITVQSAIPKLITSLILVTFSYAIAGLIIDLSYVFQSIALSTIFNSFGKGLNTNLLTGNISTTFTDINNLSFGNTLFLMTKNIQLIAVLVIGALVGAGLGALVGSFGVITAIPSAAAGAGIGAALFLLIVLVTILIILIKLLFSLIKCYVTLIIQIILGPFQIVMGAFPNSKTNFSSWLKQIIANVSVFPITLIFLVLVNVIAELVASSTTTIWTPSILAVSGNLMPFLISFGGLLMVSKLPDLVTQTIFEIKPSPYGQAIGQGFKEASTLPITGTKFAGQYASDAQYKYYNDPSTVTTRRDDRANSFFNFLGLIGGVKRKD